LRFAFSLLFPPLFLTLHKV